MPLVDWLLIGLVSLLAAAVQGATGFGFALLAVPFYLAILGSTAAVPLAIVGSLAISAALVPGLWRRAPRGLLVRLCLGTLAGLPLGLWVFSWASVDGIRIAVAVLIVTFSLALLLFGPGVPAASLGRRPVADLGIGFVSGTMATALGMPGPVVLLYLQAAGADKQASRATTLCLFVFSYLGALAMQAGLAGIDKATWLACAAMVPLAVGGALLGHLVSGRIDERLFRRAVLTILIAAGLYTLWTALAG